MGGKDAPIWASVPRPLLQRRRPGIRSTEATFPEITRNECKHEVDDGVVSDACCVVSEVVAATAVATNSCISTGTEKEDQLTSPTISQPQQISSQTVGTEPQEGWPAVWHLVTDLAAGLDSCLADFAALKASVIDCRACMSRVSNEQRIKDAAMQDLFRKALDTSESRLKNEIAEVARVASLREAAQRDELYLMMAALDDRLSDVRESGASECCDLTHANAFLSQQLTSLSASCAAEHASLRIQQKENDRGDIAVMTELREEFEAQLRVESACARYTQQTFQEELHGMLSEHEADIQCQLEAVVSMIDGHSNESNVAQGCWKHEIAEVTESRLAHEAAVSDELKQMRDEFRACVERSCSQSGVPEATQPSYVGSQALRLVSRCRTWRPSLADRNDSEPAPDVESSLSQALSGWGVRGLVGAEDVLQSWG